MSPQEKARAYRLKRLYGITVVQYDRMFDLQGGKCFVCMWKPTEKSRRLCVDHDHKDGRVRGLLCYRCNKRLLGRGLDDSALHRMAALYLEREANGKLFDGRLI